MLQNSEKYTSTKHVIYNFGLNIFSCSLIDIDE